MKRTNMLGKEVEIKCKNCGNENPVKLCSRHEDGEVRHWCDACGGMEASIPYEDELEKLYKTEYRHQPKFKDFILKKHREEKRLKGL